MPSNLESLPYTFTKLYLAHYITVCAETQLGHTDCVRGSFDCKGLFTHAIFDVILMQFSYDFASKACSSLPHTGF